MGEGIILAGADQPGWLLSASPTWSWPAYQAATRTMCPGHGRGPMTKIVFPKGSITPDVLCATTRCSAGLVMPAPSYSMARALTAPSRGQVARNCSQNARGVRVASGRGG